MKFYAEVSWSADDIQTLRPDLSQREAEEFLIRSKRLLRDRMISAGWDILERLIDLDDQLPIPPHMTCT